MDTWLGPLHVFPLATFLGGKCCHFHLHALHSAQHVGHQQTKKKATPSTETPQFGAAIIFYRTALFWIFHRCCSSHGTLLLQCAGPHLPCQHSPPQVLKNEIIWINCVGTPPNFTRITQIIECEKPNQTVPREDNIQSSNIVYWEKHAAVLHGFDHWRLLLLLLQFQPQAPSPLQCCLTPITSPGRRTTTASCALTRERQRSPAGSW